MHYSSQVLALSEKISERINTFTKQECIQIKTFINM